MVSDFLRRDARCCCRWALVFGVWLAAATLPANAAGIDVLVDQARLVKLPDRVATLIIGNPLIADAAIQPGSTMVITGKGFGTTNIIALDRTGAVLMEDMIDVHSPSGETVVIYRGAERETYSCAPSCQRRITLGDSPAFFEATAAQSVSRVGMAQGVSSGAK
jgi:Flp pilus assembly secretin CpaC